MKTLFKILLLFISLNSTAQVDLLDQNKITLKYIMRTEYTELQFIQDSADVVRYYSKDDEVFTFVIRDYIARVLVISFNILDLQMLQEALKSPMYQPFEAKDQYIFYNHLAETNFIVKMVIRNDRVDWIICSLKWYKTL